MNFGSASFSPDIYTVGNDISKTGRTGFMVGAIAELEFAKMFAVEVSPTFALKGGGYQDTKGGTDVGKYSEIDFPILFKVKLLSGRFHPYGFLGPNLGINLSATRSSQPAGGQVTDTDVKANTSGIDFALDFGGGAEFEVSKNIGLLLDVRYSLGLSNVNSAQQQQTQQFGQQESAPPSISLSGFQLMVGTIFHI